MSLSDIDGTQLELELGLGNTLQGDLKLGGDIGSTKTSIQKTVTGIVKPKEVESDIKVFANMYIESASNFHNQLNNGDVKFALKTLGIMFGYIREYLLNHATVEESEEILNSLILSSNRIKSSYSHLRQEDKEKISYEFRKMIEFLNNFIFIKFFSTSIEDKDFIKNIKDFLNSFSTRISFLNDESLDKNGEEDIGTITFSCIGYMDEYLTSPGKVETYKGILRLMNNFGNNEVFVRGCLAYIVSMLKLVNGDFLFKSRLIQLGSVLCENIENSRLKSTVLNEITQNSFSNRL